MRLIDHQSIFRGIHDHGEVEGVPFGYPVMLEVVETHTRFDYMLREDPTSGDILAVAWVSQRSDVKNKLLWEAP